MNSVPRALVVGASETAELLHLPVLANLRDAGRLELVEICDLRLDRAVSAARRFGFSRAGGDAAAAIQRNDIDAVYLFGGARMHHALGRATIAAGKHLFVEKPVAPTYREARELADAAHERGLIAVGGHNRRFLPAFDRIRADLGSVGCSFAEAVFHKPQLGVAPPFGAATWLSGNGIHALDSLLFMMGGPPEWVSAHAGGTGTTPAVFTAMMRWPNGAQAVLLCNNEAGARREEYGFHAPGKSWRVTDDALTIDQRSSRISVALAASEESFVAEHQAFLDAVAGGPSPCHSIAALAPSLFVAELIEAGHHGPVRLPAREPPTAAPRLRHTVLVASTERMRSMLGTMPADWRLVSLEEIERSSIARPDISVAILGPGAAPLGVETLDKLPNLAVVGVVGLSLRRFGADRLLDRGIALVNASDAYAQSVGEFALALAILGRRRAFGSSEAMRRGGWGVARPPGGLLGAALALARLLRSAAVKLRIAPALRAVLRAAPALRRLSGIATLVSRDLVQATVGLIGWGANARAFADRLRSAGARVIVYSEHASAEEIRQAGAEPAPLSSVLAADVVSLHRGLSPATRHCLGEAELARLRPGAVLINIARGALIDQDALVARLRRGDIVACLDTFDQEPLPRRHPLRRMRNVFLTAHIAGGSQDMQAAAALEVIAKVTRWLDGDTAEAVTAQRLSTMT